LFQPCPSWVFLSAAVWSCHSTTERS